MQLSVFVCATILLHNAYFICDGLCITEGDGILVYRLDLFHALTQGGRELELFEEDTGSCFVEKTFLYTLHNIYLSLNLYFSV